MKKKNTYILIRDLAPKTKIFVVCCKKVAHKGEIIPAVSGLGEVHIVFYRLAENPFVDLL